MADPGKRREATYQDVLDAPENMVAEIIDGELVLSPRPAMPHTIATSFLGSDPGMAHPRSFPTSLVGKTSACHCD